MPIFTFQRFYRLVLLFVLSIIIGTAISACSKPSVTSTKSNSTLTKNCRVTQHAMGETCIPLDPQRIVVTDHVMLEATLALNQKPIGSPLRFIPPSVSTKDIKDIVDLSDVETLNIERIVKLKPDLILGTTYSTPPYSLLARIAPTVLIDFKQSGNWKEHFAFAGEVLGKPEQVKQIMTDYYQRVEKFKQKINTNSKTEVSVVRIYPTHINLYTEGGFIGTVLEDAGLSRPPSQNLDLEQTERLTGSSRIQYTISKEVIDKADGDIVFVIVTSCHLEAKNLLASLKADPLWLKLEAVQQEKVYEVERYWLGAGPIAANLVLDDLFKYLVEQ